MPNVNFLTGLVRSRSTGASGHKLRAYPLKNGAFPAMYQGTPVKLSAGTLDVATNNAAVVGVCRSFAWIDKTTGQPQYSRFIPANTSQKGSFPLEGFTQPFALVDDDPQATWIIRSTTSVSAGHLGQLAIVTNAGGGSGTTGRSTCELDIHDTLTSISAGFGMFRVIGVYRISEITSTGAVDNNIDNDPTTLLEVQLQNHLYR